MKLTVAILRRHVMLVTCNLDFLYGCVRLRCNVESKSIPVPTTMWLINYYLGNKRMDLGGRIPASHPVLGFNVDSASYAHVTLDVRNLRGRH